MLSWVKTIACYVGPGTPPHQTVEQIPNEGSSPKGTEEAAWGWKPPAGHGQLGSEATLQPDPRAHPIDENCSDLIDSPADDYCLSRLGRGSFGPLLHFHLVHNDNLFVLASFPCEKSRLS